VQKSVLVDKYLQQFSQFANSIDFKKLQWLKTKDRAKENTIQIK
jgi:hypothetical protein